MYILIFYDFALKNAFLVKFTKKYIFKNFYINMFLGTFGFFMISHYKMRF